MVILLPWCDFPLPDVTFCIAAVMGMMWLFPHDVTWARRSYYVLFAEVVPAYLTFSLHGGNVPLVIPLTYLFWMGSFSLFIWWFGMKKGCGGAGSSALHVLDNDGPGSCAWQLMNQGSFGGSFGGRSGGRSVVASFRVAGVFSALVFICVLCLFLFPECVARVPVSLWGSGGWGCVRSTSVLKLQSVKIVSHEMLVLVLPRVSFGVSGFPVPSPCLWGKLQNLSFGGFQAGCHVVLRGRRGTLWHSNLFDNVSKMSKLEEVSHEMLIFLHPRVSSQVSGSPVASPCLRGKLQNLSFSKVSNQVVMSFCVALYAPHSTLYTPHSTVYTLHFTLLTPHSTRYTPHFTLCTLHSSLHTLHSTLYTPHSTLYTLHFTLHTPHPTHHTLHSPHSTLYIPHSTLYTPHSLLYSPHSTLSTSHSTLYTLHSTFHTLHSTLLTLHSTLQTLPFTHSTLPTPHFTFYTPHFTLYTPHSTLHTLHSTLYTPHFTLHTADW